METSASKYIVIITTCPNQEEATSLATELVSRRLAACVQSSEIVSTYRWKETVERQPEIRLLIKARSASYGDIERLIQSTSSYENAEVIAIPIVSGSTAYFGWIDDETARI